MAVTSNGNKEYIRSKSLKKRNSLTFDSVEKYSTIITNKLLTNFDFKNQKTHLFYPIKSKKEVNTWLIHRKLIALNCKFFTSIHNSDNIWDCVQFNSKINFTETIFKVPIPKEYIKATYSEINIIIIPLLAFDRKGNRIGYGKGIYDKILSELNPNCIKIGVSFYEEEKEIINCENHDIKLDYCQTTNKLYKFI